MTVRHDNYNVHLPVHCMYKCTCSILFLYLCWRVGVINHIGIFGQLFNIQTMKKIYLKVCKVKDNTYNVGKIYHLYMV
jgi:hypothetical protein